MQKGRKPNGAHHPHSSKNSSTRHPTQNRIVDIRSHSKLMLPTHQTRVHETQALTRTTTNNQDDPGLHAIKSVTTSTCTNTASKHTIVPVSGSPRDILCGRGLHIMNHHGNHNLHLIADSYRQGYLTSTRKEKAAIARHIVQKLKSTGARFLRRYKDNGKDKWVEVEDDTAYRKVSHALRLRRSDHGQSFLKSVVHRQKVGSHQYPSLTPHSTSRIATVSTLQDVDGMSGGPEDTLSDPSKSSASCLLATHMPLPSVANQPQGLVAQSIFHPAAEAQQSHSIVPMTVVGGYDNVVIDPILFSQVFASTLVHLTQWQHHQPPSVQASFVGFQNTKRRDGTPDEGSR